MRHQKSIFRKPSKFKKLLWRFQGLFLVHSLTLAAGVGLGLLVIILYPILTGGNV